MKLWQWLAVPLALALLAIIVVFPFTYYADPDETVDGQLRQIDEGRVAVDVGWRWRHGFFPTWRIRELNNREIQLSSSGNASVDWLVLMLFAGCTALLCGFILGYRPPTFPARRKVLAEACWGFALLGLAGVESARLAADGFSWKAIIFGVVCALGGLFLLWESVSARSTRVHATSGAGT